MPNVIPAIGKVNNQIIFKTKKQPNKPRVWPATTTTKKE